MSPNLHLGTISDEHGKIAASERRKHGKLSKSKYNGRLLLDQYKCQKHTI